MYLTCVHKIESNNNCDKQCWLVIKSFFMCTFIYHLTSTPTKQHLSVKQWPISLLLSIRNSKSFLQTILWSTEAMWSEFWINVRGRRRWAWDSSEQKMFADSWFEMTTCVSQCITRLNSVFTLQLFCWHESVQIRESRAGRKDECAFPLLWCNDVENTIIVIGGFKRDLISHFKAVPSFLNYLTTYGSRPSLWPKLTKNTKRVLIYLS